jgi:hypothetical protein
MKSAYELAIERLEKASPSLSLTENQKKELAEVDSVYRAKIAEKELFLRNQIQKRKPRARSTILILWRSNSPQNPRYTRSAKQRNKNSANSRNR